MVDVGTDFSSLGPYSFILLYSYLNRCGICPTSSDWASDCYGCDIFRSPYVKFTVLDSIRIGIEWKTGALHCFNHDVFEQNRNNLNGGINTMNDNDDNKNANVINSMESCKDGDVITMVIDFYDNKILIEKNFCGKSVIIFENIKEKQLHKNNFRFSVCWNDEDTSIELISSKTRKRLAPIINALKEYVADYDNYDRGAISIQAAMRRVCKTDLETNWVNDFLTIGAKLISTAGSQMQQDMKKDVRLVNRKAYL